MLSMEVALHSAFTAFKGGQLTEVEHQSRRILRDAPSSAPALFLLAYSMSDRGDDLESLRLYEDALAVDPQYIAPYRALSRVYYSLGKTAKAADLYRRWASVEPNDPEVKHMTLAVTGENTPLRCSEDFVHAHFNKFASDFDEVLVKRLAYRGPEVIEGVLAKHRDPTVRALDILDAGCGTGLCGPLLRPRARTLVGVDLADKMLERAKERDCYDKLIISDLCEYLESTAQAFDVIASSDVLVYFGDLGRVMRAAFGALRNGGLLVITVEALQDDAADPYRLTTSGRYAHRDSYVRDVVSQTGLSILSLESERLRWEGGKPVMFHCLSAEKI